MFVLYVIFFMSLLIISCAVSQIKDLIIKLIDMLIVWIVVYIFIATASKLLVQVIDY